MSTRDEHIVEQAIAIISRYGYKKTTMGDLADAAGVSRQTLYNKFPNKEEVLRAAVRHSNDAGLSQLKAKWEIDETLAERLESFFQIGPLTWYDTLIATPDAADLMEGVNAHAADLMQEATRIWIAALAELFSPYEPVLSKQETTPQQFADFVYATSASAKYSATQREELVARLATLKVAVLATLKD